MNASRAASASSKGIEANILADGSLDLEADERADLRLRDRLAYNSSAAQGHDQTDRMLAAVSPPGVAILGHPQGRMCNNRPGVTADWRTVFREAAKLLRRDWRFRRQLGTRRDGRLASWPRLALEEGCLFALDGDAHSIAEYAFTDYAIAIARVGRRQSAADRVVNCWDETKFNAWLEARSVRRL